MNTFTEAFFKAKSIDILKLSNHHLSIIELYDANGLLRYSELEEANTYIGESLTDLIVSDSFSESLITLFAAAEKETLINVCLTMEMFVKEIEPNKPVYCEGRLNIQNLDTLLEEKYHTIPGFAIYHPQNEDYKSPGSSIYKIYLYNLHRYCGIKESDIEAFFEPDFQGYFNFFVNAANALGQDRLPEFIRIVLEKFEPGISAGEITSLKELDSLVLEKKDGLLNFLAYLLSHFARIRCCTTAMIETLMVPVHLTEKVSMKGPGQVNNAALDEFNGHITAILSDGLRTFAAKDRNEIMNYLGNDFRNDARTGGFVEIIKRQTLINEDAGWGKNPFTYLLSDQRSMDIAAKHYQLNVEDLQTMTRINFVLANRGTLSDEEWGLVAGKIVPLLKSTSSNYFSDIFELYFLTITRKSGLTIRLIPSKSEGGHDISTCDYRIGHNMGADAKCIIGGNIGFNQISYWINKAGGQVKSSIGWEQITFGGAVIGIRDKRFDFLNPLKEFSGKNPFDEKERIPVFSLFYELYSEFRRHTETDPDQIKFIVFYYLPETDTTIFKYGMQPFTPKAQQEVMFIFSTKYASETEIDQMKGQFAPVANFLFKFKNNLN